jgi:transcriptional repressor NrdR
MPLQVLRPEEAFLCVKLSPGRANYPLVFLIALWQYVVMVCIYCGNETQVANSRPQKQLNQVWRRRKCLQCQAIFSTHEVAAYDTSWRVKTINDGLVPFKRNKLLVSLYKSLAHRPTALEDATALTDTIIGLLLKSAQNGLIEAQTITNNAAEVLHRFDTAAAVHYRAFHQV